MAQPSAHPAQQDNQEQQQQPSPPPHVSWPQFLVRARWGLLQHGQMVGSVEQLMQVGCMWVSCNEDVGWRARAYGHEVYRGTWTMLRPSGEQRGPAGARGVRVF